MIQIPLISLRLEATDEAYAYFDQHIRTLPRNSKGQINGRSFEMWNTDVDAFRHAYVSGVFTQEYNEQTADFLGRLNEMSLTREPEDEENMDLWNNAVGRKYGKSSKSRKNLADKLKKALENGELIISPKDPRKFKGNKSRSSIDTQKQVVVIEEEDTGRNEKFLDLISGVIMSKDKFVSQIQEGQYPGYHVASIDQDITPMSKPDDLIENNLG